MKLSTIRLSPSARSVVDVDIVEGYDPEIDPAGRLRIAAVYTDGVLRVPGTTEDRESLYVALTDFANDCDEIAEDKGRDTSDRALHRAARASITAAASKVLAAAYSGPCGLPTKPSF